MGFRWFLLFAISAEVIRLSTSLRAYLNRTCPVRRLYITPFNLFWGHVIFFYPIPSILSWSHYNLLSFSYLELGFLTNKFSLASLQVKNELPKIFLLMAIVEAKHASL